MAISNAGEFPYSKFWRSIPLAICIFIGEFKNIKKAR